MMAHDSLDPGTAALLAQYWAGEASAADITAAEAWLALPEHRARGIQLRAAWEAAGIDSNDRSDAESFAERVFEQVRTGEVRTKRRVIGVPQRSHRVFRTLGLWGGSAIALALVVGLTFGAGKTRSSTNGATRTISTKANQQATFSLPDGSQVALSPHTTIKLAEFGARQRRVILENGEAYFTVATAAGAPFVVQSGSVTTQVLGTSFLVRHTAGTSGAHIAVATGKVRVVTQSHQTLDATLGAGDVGDLTDSTKDITTVDAVAPGTERLRDKLVFHDTPVSVVVEVLHRWYGYQFRFSDPSIATRSVTLGVSMQSSSAALATLQQVLNVDLAFVGDTVTLTQAQTRPVQGTPRLHNYEVFTPTREVGR